MSNSYPPWVAYRALMLVRLIGLDKYPGVRTLGAGETWRWMLVKCVLVVTGVDVKEACGTEQLFSGIEAGIEGGYMRCVFCGKIMPRRRTGCSSSMMLVMSSMRRTAYP